LPKGVDPLIVDLYLCDYCDRGCYYCQFAESRRGGMMALETLQAGLKLASQWHGHLQLQISGTGEPLLHPRLYRMIEEVLSLQRPETILFYTSGCRNRREEELLASIAPLINGPLHADTTYPVVDLIVKYDGTEEAAERIRRTLQLPIIHTQVAIQVTPPYTEETWLKMRREAEQLVRASGFTFRRSVEDPDAEEDTRVWQKKERYAFICRRAISPIGKWAENLPGYSNLAGEQWAWEEESGVYYWALHVNGRVAFCENATRGLLSISNFQSLTELHRHLHDLRRRYHHKDQATHPEVCNSCPVHLGTTADP